MKRKKCKSCNKIFSEEFYYRNSQGYIHGICKKCYRNKVYKYRVENKERIIESLRISSRDSIRKIRRNNPKAFTKKISDWRIKNPKKHRAHRMVEWAIRKGELKRKSCEICGKSNAQGHHPNYDRPLEVIWLCPIHHKEIHKHK